MMDVDTHTDSAAAAQAIETLDGLPPGSEQDAALGLNADHNDPLAWISFWPA